MITEKFRNALPLFLMMGFITLVYAPAAFILLRGYETNIAFTQKELRGLADYQKVITQYFALHEKPQVDKPQATELRNQIRTIGDTSNLILDPEIHSYYAMDILFQHIPLLVEHVEMYRFDALSLLDASHHLERLHYSVNKVSEFPSPQQASISKSFAHIQDKLPTLRQMSSEDKLFFIAELKQLKDATAWLLDELLKKRLTAQQQQYHLVLAIVVAVYGVLMGLMLFAVRSYADKREAKLSRERYRLITKLSQKNEELEKFSYAAAHDLKEPVRTMRSFAMLLAEESGDRLSASAASYIEILKSTAKRAEQMINDLLNYSKLSDEEQTLEACDTAEEIRAVLQDLQSHIVAAQAQFTQGDMPRISTVPSMFRRVMLNLIDNAIKYRKEDTPPHIHISAEHTAEGWQFCVADNGIGIAPEHHVSIFEPFRRLHSKSSEGNGIGLTTCKKIIERLGGRIWVESHPMQGACIYFTIPA